MSTPGAKSVAAPITLPATNTSTTISATTTSSATTATATTTRTTIIEKTSATKLPETVAPAIIITNKTETQVNKTEPVDETITQGAADPNSFDPSDEGSGGGNGDIDSTIEDSTVITRLSTEKAVVSDSTVVSSKKAPNEQRSNGKLYYNNNKDSLHRQQEPAVSSMNKNIGWAIGVTLGVIFITG